MTSTTPETPTDSANTSAWKFVQALKRLAGIGEPAPGQKSRPEKNLGALAALRRGLGKVPGTVAEMYPYVMLHLPERANRQEENAYFLIAALFAWSQRDWPADPSGRQQTKRERNFGASFRRLVTASDSASLEKRFSALLEARSEDLPEHLRHAVGLLKSKEIPVDWVQLLNDVRAWESDDRRVQRAWARAYWGAASSDATTRQPSSDADAAQGPNDADGSEASEDYR